jgi:16S rRNA (cytosine967-C5)-methyltransferase
MRLPPAILGSTEEVLREILRFTAPADVTLSRYFKDHQRLGSRERGVVAEAVYAVLRNKTFFTDFGGTGGTPSMRRLALMGLAETAGIESLSGLHEDETEFLTRIKEIDRSLLPPLAQANMPQWLYDKLVAQYGESEAKELAAVLNTPAPLDLRVNSIKANRDEVIAQLAEAPIVAEPTPYSPLGLRIKKKPTLQNLPLFKEGAIEVQDEGSQVLAQILAARRGEMVVDFCAGAGDLVAGAGTAFFGIVVLGDGIRFGACACGFRLGHADILVVAALGIALGGSGFVLGGSLLAHVAIGRWIVVQGGSRGGGERGAGCGGQQSGEQGFHGGVPG